jgi:hypothetical protein
MIFKGLTLNGKIMFDSPDIASPPLDFDLRVNRLTRHRFACHPLFAFGGKRGFLICRIEIIKIKTALPLFPAKPKRGVPRKALAG